MNDDRKAMHAAEIAGEARRLCYEVDQRLPGSDMAVVLGNCDRVIRSMADEIGHLKAEVERLTRELASSREDARRFYRVDGTSELMESPEAVVRARIAAAAEIERLRAEVERLTRERGEAKAEIAEAMDLLERHGVTPDCDDSDDSLARRIVLICDNEAQARQERDEAIADHARLTRERDEARAFREAAEQDAVRAAGKYEALKRLREAPKPRPDREELGRAAYESHGTKGLHPWEKLNESAREDYREPGCAVAAALQSPAPPDIEAVARRIVDAVCWRKGWDESTVDSKQIGERYAELKGRPDLSFIEAELQAKREFVARVLGEMGPPKPALTPEFAKAADIEAETPITVGQTATVAPAWRRRYHSECRCACHYRPSVIHITACCEPDPPADGGTAP